MGLFSKIIEKREQIHNNIQSDDTRQDEIIDAEGLLSAMRDSDTVTVENALKVPCFASCVSLLSSIVAMLPLKLYREGDGETKEVTAAEDMRVKYLNDESGDTLDSFQIKAAVVSDYLIYGNGYIYIDWQRNNIKGLRYVDSRDVGYRMNSDPIFKSASYMVGGKTYPPYHFISLLRKTKNGVSGVGVFEEGKEALAIAYNTKVFQHYNILNGGNKNGLLQTQRGLTQEALDKLKIKWKLFRSNKNKDPLVLNNGLEFKEISSTSVEMQLNENIKTNNDEVCLLFGLAPEIISGKATPDQFADSVRTAVQPILEAFQCALNRATLLEGEKGKMYWAFDTTELLKGDMLKRYQAYQIALQSNFMQIDEVRYKEDLPRLGFNYIKLGLQDVLLDPKTGTIYTANTNQMVKIGEKGLQSEADGGIIDVEKRYNPNHDPTDGRFTSGKGDIVKLPDIEIGRSIGAKAKNYDVFDLETGDVYHFVEGTKIQNVQVFAGKGTKTAYRNAEGFANIYGGKAADWQHVKGFGTLNTPDGDRRAEVHWSQCESVGKVEFFVKEWLE